jgi:hypothetical protein
MTRVTPWLTAAAFAALTAAPAAAQQPAPPTPAPEPHQQQTQPATSTQSAEEHINKAKLALDGIPKDAVTGAAATKVAELRKHIDQLEKATAKSWPTHVTAIDSAVTGLMADESLTPDVKAKLEEVKTHVTAFASAKSGTSPAAQPPAGDPPPSSPPSTTAPSTPPPTAPGTTGATPTQPTTGTTGTTGTMTGTQTPTQQPPTTTAAPAAPAAQPDQSAARQHLTEARRVLAEVTQLPAATQLQGEARTQVAQLITNFNALITAQSDWKEKYSAVEQNLNKLLGSSAGAAVAGTTGSTSPSATAGTSGTASTGAVSTINPAIKARLEEFRKHLTAFNAAVSGQIPQ